MKITMKDVDKAIEWFMAWYTINCTITFTTKYSEVTDNIINMIFDSPDYTYKFDSLKCVIKCTSRLSGDSIDIWIANRFYAYGTIYRLNDNYVNQEAKSYGRPSIITMARIYNLEKDLRKADNKIKKKDAKNDKLKSLHDKLRGWSEEA